MVWPRSWAKKFDIKKGDELEVDESGNKLLIGTHKDITLNEVTIDVSNLDRTSILLYLRSAYRKGYDMIIINYTNTTTTHLRTGKDIKVNSIIAEEVRRLIGVEIINQKGTSWEAEEDDDDGDTDDRYIDDIADGTIRALKPVGYEIINLGSDHPVKLNYVIKLLEKNLGKKAKIKNLLMHPADVKATWAHIGKAKKLLGWKPKMPLEQGVENTVRWFLENKKFLKSLKWKD